MIFELSPLLRHHSSLFLSEPRKRYFFTNDLLFRRPSKPRPATSLKLSLAGNIYQGQQHNLSKKMYWHFEKVSLFEKKKGNDIAMQVQGPC